MPEIEVNNTSLYYTDQGKGETIIFIHGSLSDYRSWKNQVEYFSKNFRVIIFSRRYHFPNDTNKKFPEYSIETHFNDLTTLVGTLKLENVNLIGSSYGAFIALFTALKKEIKIKSLVLGEPPVLPLLQKKFSGTWKIFLSLLSDPNSLFSYFNFIKKGIKPAQSALRKGDLQLGVKLFVDGVSGKGSFERLPESARASIMDNAIALKEELLGPGFPDFDTKQLTHLKIPVLFVLGNESPAFFHAITNMLIKKVPGAKKLIIPDSSHNIHKDNSKDYNQLLQEFLQKKS